MGKSSIIFSANGRRWLWKGKHTQNIRSSEHPNARVGASAHAADLSHTLWLRSVVQKGILEPPGVKDGWGLWGLDETKQLPRTLNSLSKKCDVQELRK